MYICMAFVCVDLAVVSVVFFTFASIEWENANILEASRQAIGHLYIYMSIYMYIRIRTMQDRFGEQICLSWDAVEHTTRRVGAHGPVSYPLSVLDSKR